MAGTGGVDYKQLKMNGQIRKVETRDAGRIAEIYNEYVLRTTVTFETEAVGTEAMAGRVSKIASTFPFFVLEYDGVVLGYCLAHPWKERAAFSRTLETTVYLDSKSCGMGFGRVLMERLIEECRALGFHSLIACVTADNDRSVRFHQELGFRQVSHFSEVGFKFGRWIDVIDLELVL